jgi:hypothetical protein
VRAFVLSLVTLCVATNAHAQTPEQLAAVERAGDIGLELYEHDQAAWHGTDAMLKDVADPRGEGFRGYITERTAEGVVLLFVKGGDDSLSAAWRALYRDGEVREFGRVDRPLSEAQARIFRARQIAIRAPLPQQCAPNYNTVTLPRAEPGADGVDIDVYLMPAMTTNNEVPFGGHFRLAVDTGAGVVRETQSFTNACLTMPRDNAAGLWVTQLIGDTPTEVHVFASLTVGMPVYVGARSGLWSVEGRTIRYVEAMPAN